MKPNKCKTCGRHKSNFETHPVKWVSKSDGRILIFDRPKHHDFCSDKCKMIWDRKYKRSLRLPISRALRQTIMERDHHECQYCGKRATDIDHVYPVSRGGTNAVDNLVACCKSCNSKFGDKVFANFEAKQAWILKVYEKKSPVGLWRKWVYGGMKNLRP